MPPELGRFINKNLILLSAFLFLIILFIPLYAPFDSNVWGNVSEWSMVLVTAITAIYLYKTLQSQITLTKIEQNRYDLEILPDVSMSHDLNTKFVRLTPINRPLRNASVTITKASDKIQLLAQSDPNLISTFFVGHPMPIQYTLNNNELQSPFILFTIKIIFYNELDQKYLVDIAVTPTGNPVKHGPYKIS